MLNNREARLAQRLDSLLPLVGQQMLTAQRVLTALGHQCGQWHVPPGGAGLLSLLCKTCLAEAAIHLIGVDEGAQYTVLLLPPGTCAFLDARHQNEVTPSAP